jgi:hypothetical protein
MWVDGEFGLFGLGTTRGLLLARIHKIAEILARLEVGNALGRDRDGGSGLRITSRTRLALARAEAAKSTNFDLVARFDGPNDRIEECVDDDLAITARKVTEGYDVVDEFGFGHGEGSGCYKNIDVHRMPTVSVYAITSKESRSQGHDPKVLRGLGRDHPYRR